MDPVYFLTVLLHILAAAVWIGGMVFLGVGILPLLRHPQIQPLRATVLHLVGLRLRVLGWASLLVLLVTGILNLGARGYGWGDLLTGKIWEGDFGRTLMEKVISFFLLVLLNAVHDFWVGPKASQLSQQGSAAVERWRKAAMWLGRITLLISLWMVALGIMLVRGRPF